jgi:hypothetical protein
MQQSHKAQILQKKEPPINKVRKQMMALRQVIPHYRHAS